MLMDVMFCYRNDLGTQLEFNTDDYSFSSKL